MEINALEKVINYFGSTTRVASTLGIKKQSVSGWFYGRSNVPLEIALHIELLMCGEVTWKDLVSFEIVYRLRNFCLSLKEAGNYPCELTHALMNRIIAPNALKNQKNQPTYLHRPPCIDENYKIIFGYKVFCHYQENNKKTIPCWKISLASLAEGKYVTEDLTKAFLISERVAIGIAMEAFIGNRQGQRTDLLNEKKESLGKGLVKNFSQVAINKGTKTREFTSKQLGFKNFTTYEQAKTILQFGCSELINAADQEKLSISKGARLAKLSHEEQRKRLSN